MPLPPARTHARMHAHAHARTNTVHTCAWAAVEEMLADLDLDESDTIDNTEFWRQIDGAMEMNLS